MRSKKNQALGMAAPTQYDIQNLQASGSAASEDSGSKGTSSKSKASKGKGSPGGGKKRGLSAGIWVPLLILLLLIGSFFGARKFRTSKIVADVVPVSSINWGYMEDSMSIDGVVYDQDSQIIYPDVTQIVSEVYVTQGQQVKKGDKLMAYDTDSQQLTLELRKIAVQKSKADLENAKKELETLRKTKPVPDGSGSSGGSSGGGSGSSEGGSQGQGESTTPLPTKPEHKKTMDAWNYLDATNLTDFFLDPNVAVGSSSGSSTDSSSNSDSSSEDSSNEATDENAESDSADNASSSEGDSSGDESGTEGASGGDDSETEGDDPGDGAAEWGDDLVEIPPDGSLQNPYRYLITEDGAVYGSFLNAFAKQTNKYASIEVREGNVKSGDIIASVLINSEKIVPLNDDDYWYVILRGANDDPIAKALQELINEINKQQSQGQGEAPSDDGGGSDDGGSSTPTSYTAAELKEAINRAELEVKDRDLEVRRAELDLKILMEQLEDGVVVAKKDGVVTIVKDKDNPPQDGSPFLKVDAGAGVVVQGTISELLLETLEPGQEITASDWETGATYTGHITSVDDYPSDNAYYYGGNPNASYYGFLAYFDEAQDLEPGHYLQLSLDANANQENALYIPNAYIRRDAGGKYVMKDDNGVLAKQYIKTGKSYYGYVTGVLEGLTENDHVAFPYGDGAIEGVKTKISEGEEMMF